MLFTLSVEPVAQHRRNVWAANWNYLRTQRVELADSCLHLLPLRVTTQVVTSHTDLTDFTDWANARIRLKKIVWSVKSVAVYRTSFFVTDSTFWVSHRLHRFPQIFIVHHFITCVQKKSICVNLWDLWETTELAFSSRIQHFESPTDYTDFHRYSSSIISLHVFKRNQSV